MSLFSQRHGYNKAIPTTYDMIPRTYNLLFNCCSEYFDNLAWKYNRELSSDRTTCYFDESKFNDFMYYITPTLYRNSLGKISNYNTRENFSFSVYDQFALLDLIEIIGKNSKDVEKLYSTPYINQYKLKLFETNKVKDEFRNKINEVFDATRLLYRLNEHMEVERIFDKSTIINDLEDAIGNVQEPGLKDLLEEAVNLFRKPKPSMNSLAIEKIWDAFERMKSLFGKDKKTSTQLVIDKISANQVDFRNLLDEEFKTLTMIGNNFQIRHYETPKIPIVDENHRDYLFNRCAALILLGLKFLNQANN